MCYAKKKDDWMLLFYEEEKVSFLDCDVGDGVRTCRVASILMNPLVFTLEKLDFRSVMKFSLEFSLHMWGNLDFYR